jgi:hypothetical protein
MQSPGPFSRPPTSTKKSTVNSSFKPASFKVSEGTHSSSQATTPNLLFKHDEYSRSSSSSSSNNNNNQSEIKCEDKHEYSKLKQENKLEVPEIVLQSNSDKFISLCSAITGIKAVESLPVEALVLLLVISPLLFFGLERGFVFIWKKVFGSVMVQVADGYVPVVSKHPTLSSYVFLNYCVFELFNALYALYMSPVNIFNALHQTIASMSVGELVVAVAMGSLLSFTLDSNTAKTDANIRTACKYLFDTTAGTAERQNEERSPGMLQHQSAPTHRKRSSSSAERHDALSNMQLMTYALVQITLLPSKIPIIVRFIATVLLFGAMFRSILGAAAEVVADTVSVYTPMVFIVVCCCAIIYCIVVAARMWLRSRAAQKNVTQEVAVFAKALLLSKARAYPIAYIMEEVRDAIQAATRGTASTSSPPLSHSSPIRSVAAQVIEPIRDGEASSTYQQQQQQQQQQHQQHNWSSGATAATGSESEPAPGPRLTPPPSLQGYKLRSIWPEVQKVVERDSRIMKLDVIMDGRKQACWRVLAASSSAKI